MLLSLSGFSHIITMDLHQKEVQGFFDCPVDNLRASNFLIQYIKESVSDLCPVDILKTFLLCSFLCPVHILKTSNFFCPVGLPIVRFRVQIPARAEIWIEISASSVPLIYGLLKELLFFFFYSQRLGITLTLPSLWQRLEITLTLSCELPLPDLFIDSRLS